MSGLPDLNKLDMDFTDNKIYQPQYQHQCYRIWQSEQAEKRRSSHTQFNLYQCRSLERLAEHNHWKHEADRSFEAAKDIVERRLSQACACESCHLSKGRNYSGSEPASPTNSFSSGHEHRRTRSETSATNIPSSTGSRSSQDSVSIGPLPSGRHHQRRKRSLQTPEL